MHAGMYSVVQGQAGWNCFMEVCGVGMHRVGMQIVFQCDV